MYLKILPTISLTLIQIYLSYITIVLDINFIIIINLYLTLIKIYIHNYCNLHNDS